MDPEAATAEADDDDAVVAVIDRNDLLRCTAVTEDVDEGACIDRDGAGAESARGGAGAGGGGYDADEFEFDVKVDVSIAGVLASTDGKDAPLTALLLPLLLMLSVAAPVADVVPAAADIFLFFLLFAFFFSFPGLVAPLVLLRIDAGVLGALIAFSFSLYCI